MSGPITFRFPRPAAVLASALLLSALAGCGGVDSDQEAINDAAVELNALSVAGSTPLPSTRRAGIYDGLISKLQPVAQSGNPGQKAAASLLLARAQAGKGEIAAQQAANAEAAALYQAEVLRAAIDQYISQHSVADARSGYDPAQDLADIDAQVAERQRELEQARTDREAQVARIDALQAKADQAAALARQEREREAQLRRDLAGVSEQQRDSVLQQAREVRRAGDAHDKDASYFAAEVAKERPEAESMQRQIERLSKQVELLENAKREVGARVEQSRASAEQARAEAQKVGESITALAAELEKLRAATDGPNDQAVRAFTSAAASAKNAGAVGGSQGKAAAMVAAGSYQQALGDALATRARGLQAYAVAMEGLASVRPPLAGEYAARAREAATAADQVRTEAKEAYSAARSSYESGGAARELLERVNTSLATLAGEGAAADAPDGSEAETPAAEGGETPAPADSDEGASAPATGGFDRAAIEAEVREAVMAVLADVKTSGLEAVARATRAEDPESREIVGVMIRTGTVLRDLDLACTEKFGDTVQGLVAKSENPAIRNNPMIGAVDKMSARKIYEQAETVTADQIEVEVVSATEAKVLVPGDTKQDTLVKVDGQWKSDISELVGDPGTLPGVRLVDEHITPVFEAVLADVKADKYATGEAMLNDLSTRLMAAAGRLAPGAKPGTAPPGGG